ncbi:1,4-alpha-glucan branching protein GlgB [Arcticibacterium luteifluviistationis]|uniref:1,4-alpha-glucan branching enzyme GlgB n=1 Tax=Arcticibacterium luteifluviistationis TaxID=1784714 RepID=A0A2Z4GC17_9BACT|nr:1,4-alpha-glucan branching protein GlgB [Arcticibacterium luteifluviistationis]AWV98608.1 1,4-alpha-glucan branching enzyme [Arcticibacterium luteifluviistationis]
MSFSLLSDYDIHLFKSGKHYKLYEKLGSHVVDNDGQKGTYFAVWAPNAEKVSVIGDFNGWNKTSHELNPRWDQSGIWETFIPEIGNGEVYKYFIKSNTGEELEKADPFALMWEKPPKTASIVWDTYYEWSDKNWMDIRQDKNSLDSAYSVYEVHLGSWKRDPADNDRRLSYREIARDLVPYVKEMGFTHVELMPIMHHPYEPSWGYQITGYFAASSIFGNPQDLMFLIEELHKNEIGVILDWVPSHFPGDATGLFRFDGTALYEHENPHEGYHPDWKSYIFNYGRFEVRSFLISNALFWLDRFHVDGLRVDAVASMLYRDYSRNEGEWIPNIHGGRENLEVISLLKEINEEVYASYPGTQTIAEESTAFPGVSRPTFSGGLGFGMKWMMGWMNDTLAYFEKDAAFRKFHQKDITFSTVYAFTENFMLPLSHDEVVYGKGSLLDKMPGDDWQKFANLRLLYTYMFTHPGAKLLFMGGEFGQKAEWDFKNSLDWHELENPLNKGMAELVKGLNNIYKTEESLTLNQFSHTAFQWIDTMDEENSILFYKRQTETEEVYIVLNMTPVPRDSYQLGVDKAGTYQELLNSDDGHFGGSGISNGSFKAKKAPYHGLDYSVIIDLPPLAGVIFKRK